ncbi:uncharacterized protein LOC112347906 [Selaginella moellendorffii]|uniref:uncharacterized protein LOC112347906 n=1 Tax=Selaginella moellendorffii TaxID=88036 RepID=UPI000D1CC326|nr:uncharacterized protein LOC112347906 [Selaginella moellendorffii]|eukprot:XP_024535353.1 uncharacterized protein LOC112347906 [Selaginella moellendorffii]
MEEEDDDDEWDRDLAMLEMINEASTRLEFSDAQPNKDPFEQVLKGLEARDKKFKDLEESLHEESNVNLFDIGNYACSKGDDGSRVLERAKALLDTCERRTKYSSVKFSENEGKDFTDEMLLDDPVFSLAQQRRSLVQEFKINDLERRIEKEACRQQKNEDVTRELAFIEEHKITFQKEMEIEQRKKLEEIGKEGEMALKLIEELSEAEHKNLLDLVHTTHPNGRVWRKFLHGYQGFPKAVQEAMISCETEETLKVDESKATALGEEKMLKESRKMELTREEVKTLKVEPTISEDLALACLPESIDDYFSRASRDDLCSIFQDCIRNIERFGIGSVVSQFPAGLQKVVENMHRVLVCEVNSGYDVGKLLSQKLGPSCENLATKEQRAAIVQKRVSRLIGKVLKLSVSMAGSSVPLAHKWKGLGKEAKQVGAQLALVHHARQSVLENQGATSIIINGKVVAAFKLDLRGRVLENLGGNSKMIEGSLKLNEEVQLDQVKKSWETFETKKSCCLEQVDEEASSEEKLLLVPSHKDIVGSEIDGSSQDEGDTPCGGQGNGTQRLHEAAERSSCTQAAEYQEAETRDKLLEDSQSQDGAGTSSLTHAAKNQEISLDSSSNSAAEHQEADTGRTAITSSIVEHREGETLSLGTHVNHAEEVETYSEQGWEEDEVESWEEQLLDPEETDLYSEDEWEEEAESCSLVTGRNIWIDNFKLQAGKIQALVRGHICRKQYRQLRENKKHESVCRLQALWRGSRVRRLQLLPGLRTLKSVQRESATKVQALWRGYDVRIRFNKALAKIKYVDDDDIDYECIDCILFAMEDTRTYDQDEANLVSYPAKEEQEKKSQVWEANAKTPVCAAAPAAMVIDLDFESSGTTPIDAEELTPVHQTTPTFSDSVEDQVAIPPQQHENHQDHPPACNATETEQQKKKDYMSEIAKDWGFKNEKTVKLFMKACSKKRPSKDEAANNQLLRDKRRSKKRFEVPR